MKPIKQTVDPVNKIAIFIFGERQVREACLTTGSDIAADHCVEGEEGVGYAIENLDAMKNLLTFDGLVRHFSPNGSQMFGFLFADHYEAFVHSVGANYNNLDYLVSWYIESVNGERKQIDPQF